MFRASRLPSFCLHRYRDRHLALYSRVRTECACACLYVDVWKGWSDCDPRFLLRGWPLDALSIMQETMPAGDKEQPVTAAHAFETTTAPLKPDHASTGCVGLSIGQSLRAITCRKPRPGHALTSSPCSGEKRVHFKRCLSPDWYLYHPVCDYLGQHCRQWTCRVARWWSQHWCSVPNRATKASS